MIDTFNLNEQNSEHEANTQDITDDANFLNNCRVNDICIIWMTRYCLERGSDSITLIECINALINNWSELDSATRNMLAFEIDKKIKSKYFMSEGDEVLWKSVLENHNENKHSNP